MSPSTGTVLDLVAEQVRRRPAAPAVRQDGRCLSYREIWAWAADLADQLADGGPRAGEVVGLSAERSPELIAGYLGILMSGAACLPLDPSWPAARLMFMLADAGATVVLGDAAALAALPPGPRTTITLEQSGRATRVRPPARLRARPGGLCYLIYTSGSTGQPKGVMQDHRCLLSVVDWQCQDSACGPGDATALYAPISFDVSVQEIFATLASGGTLVCLSDADRADPSRLWPLLDRERIARLFLPFAALEALALFSMVGPEPHALREVITAGEQLKSSQPVREMFARLPGSRLVNQYGPTETHVVTCHHLGADSRAWPVLPPIGGAVRGALLAVLDDEHRPVPPGEPGQLWIGGAPVSSGYWRRPDLTADRFVRRGSTRWYAAGDLVRAAGPSLEYLGRIDDQVKVRGTRIEPGEVEIALMSHPAIQAAAVVAAGTSASARILVAFVVCSGDQADLAGISDYLAARLPPPMVPTRFIQVPRIPLTPSGKVDRQALQDSMTPHARK